MNELTPAYVAAYLAAKAAYANGKTEEPDYNSPTWHAEYRAYMGFAM